MSTALLFVGVICSNSSYKVPWVYITAVMILEIVQYSFCKSPMELVMDVPICILYFVVLCYGPFIVSLFTETKTSFCKKVDMPEM